MLILAYGWIPSLGPLSTQSSLVWWITHRFHPLVRKRCVLCLCSKLDSTGSFHGTVPPPSMDVTHHFSGLSMVSNNWIY